jgi:NAD(P)-dependent dehydrogenase (short-subunit alcohol dehydrogenase family)
MAADLSNARVLVVGSSTGIGRRIAIEAVGAARVAFSARSRDKLESAVAEAGGGVVVVGDVRRPTTAPRSSTTRSPRSAGSTSWCSRPASPLMPMDETPAETMCDVFATSATAG